MERATYMMIKKRGKIFVLFLTTIFVGSVLPWSACTFIEKYELSGQAKLLSTWSNHL